MPDGQTLRCLELWTFTLNMNPQTQWTDLAAEPQTLPCYREGIVLRPSGPLDIFKNGMEVGLWSDENTGDFFFFKLVIFLLKWADFLPYKRRLSFITDHVNGLYNNTLSKSWPSQPALLGFHSVVCNTGWRAQQECSIFCLPGRQRAGLSCPALQENSFIMQTQEPSCSIYFGDYLIIILVSLKVLERL